MAEIGTINQWNTYRIGNKYSMRDLKWAIMRTTKSEEELGVPIPSQATDACLLRRRVSSPDIKNYPDREVCSVKSFCNSRKSRPNHNREFNEFGSDFEVGARKVKISVANIIRNPRYLLRFKSDLKDSDGSEHEYQSATRPIRNNEKDRKTDICDIDKCEMKTSSARKLIRDSKFHLSNETFKRESVGLGRLHSSPTLATLSENSKCGRFENSINSFPLNTKNIANCKVKKRISGRSSRTYSDVESSQFYETCSSENSISRNSTTINLCRSIPSKFINHSPLHGTNDHLDDKLEKSLSSESSYPNDSTGFTFNNYTRKHQHLSVEPLSCDSCEDFNYMKNDSDMDFRSDEQEATIKNQLIDRALSDSCVTINSKFHNPVLTSKVCSNCVGNIAYADRSIDEIYPYHILKKESDEEAHQLIESEAYGELDSTSSLDISEATDFDTFQDKKLNLPQFQPSLIVSKQSEDSFIENRRKEVGTFGSLSDLYTDFSLISVGRFSYICCCREKFNDKNYVVKVISKILFRLSNDNSFEPTQFFDFLKSLNHPNIVKVSKVFQDKNSYYMVMERCRGPTLLELFMRHLPGTMSESQVKSIILQVFLALDVLHCNNFAHGDIKLENIMFKSQLEFDSFGRKHSLEIPLPLLNLIDLDKIKDVSQHKFKKDINFSDLYQDLSMDLSYNTNGLKYGFSGPAAYRSPESHDGILGTASDMWSCGIILYALFDGNFPFQMSEHFSLGLRREILLNQSPYYDPSIWIHHPSALDLCTRLLNPDPKARVQSAREALIHEWFSTETFEIFSLNNYN